MDKQFYQVQVNRLAETFGAQHYKRERLELLWREVEKFDPDWFKRVVDRFIADFRQAPLMPEFRNEISLERERQWQRQKPLHEQQKEGRTSCGKCDGGVVRVRLKSNPVGFFAFRCRCSLGLSDPRKFPVFSYEYEEHYEVYR